ncbi:MAG TPA: AGE family epimerase/isomerase [Alphaproteobacteria bacterium]|nr:AGE family epimerase/isomerase [Alphaproteobacteria bacterium]
MVEIPRTIEEWRAWLGDTVLPYWVVVVAVASEPAGYVEYLTRDGVRDARAEKTPLVTARLIYVFSHAHVLGLGRDVLKAAEHGFRFLVERCWDARDGGFFHKVAADGTPIDRRKDAYDHAFALFAMAWLHRATRRREPLDWAARIIAYMDEALTDPTGGYREHIGTGDPQPLPRRQNPHMHLLEAFHALFEATGDEAWLTLASAIIDLFERHFFDRETGSLGEFFTADWQPAPGALGVLREPGHHFEWVWLLHHHARLTGSDASLVAADRLYHFALRHGLDKRPGRIPAAFDEIDRMGRLVTESKLLWPQTEAVKAFLARWEFLEDRDAARRVLDHTVLLFRWFLVDETARWRNRLAADGREIPGELPVRVLYHLFLGLAELVRLWPTLPAEELRRLGSSIRGSSAATASMLPT